MWYSFLDLHVNMLSYVGTVCMRLKPNSLLIYMYWGSAHSHSFNMVSAYAIASVMKCKLNSFVIRRLNTYTTRTINSRDLPMPVN